MSGETLSKIVLLFIFLTILSSVKAQPPTAAGQKRALLIGVNYVENKVTGSCLNEKKIRVSARNCSWWSLEPKADLDLIEATLTAKNLGFKKENITRLETYAQTTRRAIISALEKLIKTTGAGDIVYIHVIAHGQPLPDQAAFPDRDEIDNSDESIVPSDYISMFDGRNNIRDDDFGKRLDELAERHPLNVTIAFDSCFSATGVKDFTLPVGGNPLKIESNDGQPDSQSGFVEKKLPDNFIFLSAASQSQTASRQRADMPDSCLSIDAGKKQEVHGFFTFFLADGLKTATAYTNYSDLIGEINRKTKACSNYYSSADRQTAQFEGNGGLVLFGSEILPSNDFIGIFIKDRTLILEAGSFRGLTEGSEFEIYERESEIKNEKRKALATARIKKANPFYSILEVPDDTQIDRLKSPHGRLTKLNNQTLKIAVRERESFNKIKGGKEILAELKAVDQDSPNMDFDVLLIPVTDCADVQNLSKEKIVREVCEEKKDFRGVLLQRGYLSKWFGLREQFKEIEQNPSMSSEIHKALRYETRLKTFLLTSNTENYGLAFGKNQGIEINMQSLGYFVEKENGEKTCTRDKLGTLIFSPIGSLRCSVSDASADVKPSSNGEFQMALGVIFSLWVKNTSDMKLNLAVFNIDTNGDFSLRFPSACDSTETILDSKKQISLRRSHFVAEGNEKFIVLVTKEPTNLCRLLNDLQMKTINETPATSWFSKIISVKVKRKPQ